MRYRLHMGYVAWLFNRISGLLIMGYLVAHIWVISHLAAGPGSYEEVMHFLSRPLFTFFELCLIGVVLFHMMNGLRLVWVDFGRGALHQKPAFWILMAIGAVVFVLCGWQLIGILLGAGPSHS